MSEPWQTCRTVRTLTADEEKLVGGERPQTCGDCGEELTTPILLVTDPLPQDPDAVLLLCPPCAAPARHAAG